MKGTKLWTQVGSPLIYGRSRSERPFTYEALLSLAIAHGLMTAASILWAGWGTPAATPLTVAGALDAAARVLPVFVVSAVVAPSVAWFMRRMGWRPTWLIAGIVGFAVSAVFQIMIVAQAASTTGK